LEAVNSGGNELHVVSPTSHDRVPGNRFVRYGGSGETLLVALPSFGKGDLFALAETVSNKGVFSNAIGVTAAGLGF
jgi:hypothetical protein